MDTKILWTEMNFNVHFYVGLFFYETYSFKIFNGCNDVVQRVGIMPVNIFQVLISSIFFIDFHYIYQYCNFNVKNKQWQLIFVKIIISQQLFNIF